MTESTDIPSDTIILEDAISLALQRGDMDKASSLLGLLARVNPDHAQVILDAIELIGGTRV